MIFGSSACPFCFFFLSLSKTHFNCLPNPQHDACSICLILRFFNDVSTQICDIFTDPGYLADGPDGQMAPGPRNSRWVAVDDFQDGINSKRLFRPRRFFETEWTLDMIHFNFVDPLYIYSMYSICFATHDLVGP